MNSGYIVLWSKMILTKSNNIPYHTHEYVLANTTYIDEQNILYVPTISPHHSKITNFHLILIYFFTN